jgi:protein NrfD
MKHPEWGLLIVIYLFLGGLSAGAMVLSALANYLGRQQRYTHLARLGACIAPFPVAIGTALLVLDLGRPMFFWKLFVAFSPESPMWVGTWLLTAFLAVSVPYAVLFLPDSRRPWKPANVAFWKNALAAAGLPLGVGIGIYTGVLLGAVPARPFWNTPMVAQLFLFSALSSAAALLMVVLPLGVGADEANEERRLLLSADVIFILLELLIILPYIVHGELSTRSARESLSLVLGGAYTRQFWFGVVLFGLLVPLFTELAHLLPTLVTQKVFRAHRPVEVVVGVLVLMGGLLLRYVFVQAGQQSHFS